MFTRGAVIIFDLEWTTWPDFWKYDWKLPGKYPEIVQIGAVKLAAPQGFTETASFDALVRPARNPILSDYFIDLTGITQEMVDRDGVPFADALAAFAAFIGAAADIASNGNDSEIVIENCGLSGIPVPACFGRSIDLHADLSRLVGVAEKSFFSAHLPELLGLPAEGAAHDALADARAIAAALRHLHAAGRL